VGLIWWLLAREVLRMRGTLSRSENWEIMPDLYFFRDPEEAQKEEAQTTLATKEFETPAAAGHWESGAAPAAAATGDEWTAPPTTFGGAPAEEWAASSWGATE